MKASFRWQQARFYTSVDTNTARCLCDKAAPPKDRKQANQRTETTEVIKSRLAQMLRQPVFIFKPIGITNLPQHQH